MACDGETLLAFFELQVGAVRLYDCDLDACVFGVPVSYQKTPSNLYDALCIEVLLRSWKLGHVARRSARSLSMLLQGPFRISG